MPDNKHRKAFVRTISAISGLIAIVCGVNLVLYVVNNGGSITSPLSMAGIGIAVLGLSRLSVSLLRFV